MSKLKAKGFRQLPETKQTNMKEKRFFLELPKEMELRPYCHF
jgi:hypothetical protein